MRVEEERNRKQTADRKRRIQDGGDGSALKGQKHECRHQSRNMTSVVPARTWSTLPLTCTPSERSTTQESQYRVFGCALGTAEHGGRTCHGNSVCIGTDQQLPEREECRRHEAGVEVHEL